jgi:hypothetical protein
MIILLPTALYRSFLGGCQKQLAHSKTYLHMFSSFLAILFMILCVNHYFKMA